MQETIIQKMALLREFQDFAENQGYTFEYNHEGEKVECYGQFKEEDAPLYAFCMTEKNSIPENFFPSIVRSKEQLTRHLKIFESIQSDDKEYFICIVPNYFIPEQVFVTPTHIRLTPLQLLDMAGHEGTHATAFYRGYRNISGISPLSESIAEASSTLLLPQFYKASKNPLIHQEKLDPFLEEKRRIHTLINQWRKDFDQLYTNKDRIEHFEQKRTIMFQQMKTELMQTTTNPLFREAFEYKFDEPFNNAALAFVSHYSKYYFHLLRFFDCCDGISDFLTRAEALPTDAGELEMALANEEKR